MIELYRNIRRRREELGMSQDTLARRVGYTSRSTIARIENGEIDIPQSKILAFAEALRTTPAELMGWTEESEEYVLGAERFYENLQPYERKILDRVQLLSRSNQIAVLGIINQLIKAQEENNK